MARDTTDLLERARTVRDMDADDLTPLSDLDDADG